jgi:Subtilisin inhibitor-like
MKRLLVAGLCVVICLAASASGVAAPTHSRLTIAYWPKGRSAGSPQRWTLRCNPAGGTLQGAREACRRLSRLERPFAPVPRDQACTLIYGGPAEALVTGRYQGRRVWARFTLANGCQIERWRRVRFLTPPLRL